MIPKKIGRYVVEEELGRGGMAVVYLATDPFVKRQVAIKLLPHQFIADPNFRARFQREAQVIASLDHPAIVAIFDFGEHEEQPFIVMRYMPGGTLADRLRNEGSLPAEEAARILTQIGGALDEAHSKGIVHRDLKPGNILFDHRGDAAIADFGIVKLAESTNTLTGTGMIGTPGYMSPEQARGDVEIDRRSDIYALGAILFEMLTGQLPYQADTPMGIAIKHVIEDVPHILSIKPDLPPAFDGVIVRAMAKEPNNRYNSATELATTITSVAKAATRQSRQAVDVTQIEIAPPRPTPQPPTPTRRPTPPPPTPTKQPTPQPPTPTRRPTPSPAKPTQAVQQPAAAQPRPAPIPAAAPPVRPVQPQEKGRKIPTWLFIVGGIFILLLCVGGAVGGFGILGNLAGSEEETATPTIETAGNPTVTTAVTAEDTPEPVDNGILAQAQAATVLVTARGSRFLEELIGSGSGIVFNDNGLVLTNYHLVEGATTIEITGSDGRMTTAEIVGTSPCDDLAVLRLDDPSFPAASIPDAADGSALVPPGGPVSLLGYAQNSVAQTSAPGTVDSAGQPAASAWGSFPNAIQIEAAAEPGLSGGPLVAENGNIVGITTIDLNSEPGGIFVLPMARIRPVLLQMQQENNLSWIGLNIGPLPGDSQIPSQEGLFVFAVAPNSPAAQTGVEAGDFVTRLGNTAIGDNDTDETLAVYCRVLRNFDEGDVLPITIQRDDETLMGEINGRPLQIPTTPTPTTQASATLRPTNTISPTPGQVTNTPRPTNTTAPPTATSAPPTQPPPTQPPPTQPPPTQPPPTSPPPTNPPPTEPPSPPTNTPEPP